MQHDSPILGIASRGWKQKLSHKRAEEIDAGGTNLTTHCAKCGGSHIGSITENKQWFTTHQCV